MSENHSIIEGIKKKIDSLVKANGKLSESNDRLLSDIERLSNQRDECLKQNAGLREELKELKFAYDMTDAGSKRRAKRRILSILREIDQCLDLISKE